VDRESRRLREEFEAKVEEPERAAAADISKARFALYGTDLYPDATFTLRLAFGNVKGYEQDGMALKPFTTLAGAFIHEKAHGGQPPYRLTDRWHSAEARLALDTPLNFVSTADIIGGNSGSPTVNRSGQLVGVI